MESHDSFSVPSPYRRTDPVTPDAPRAGVEPQEFDLGHTIAVLERTPAVLRAWLSGLPHEWTHRDEGPDTWSPFNVLGHLIDGEEKDWMVRVRVTLRDGPDRRYQPFDRFRHLRERQDASVDELLGRFASARSDNLSALRALALTPADLRRTGEHPDFGTVTLAQLLATWVTHDLSHLAQIARVMAKQYGEAVGPWAAYLSVLRR